MSFETLRPIIAAISVGDEHVSKTAVRTKLLHRFIFSAKCRFGDVCLAPLVSKPTLDNIKQCLTSLIIYRKHPPMRMNRIEQGTITWSFSRTWTERHHREPRPARSDGYGFQSRGRRRCGFPARPDVVGALRRTERDSECRRIFGKSCSERDHGRNTDCGRWGNRLTHTLLAGVAFSGRKATFDSRISNQREAYPAGLEPTSQEPRVLEGSLRAARLTHRRNRRWRPTAANLEVLNEHCRISDARQTLCTSLNSAAWPGPKPSGSRLTPISHAAGLDHI